MTGIKLTSSKIKISKKEIESYEKYIVNTYNYIATELNLEVRSIGGGSFAFEDALAFRIIEDDTEISLDRSIELRIDKNGILYFDSILGSIQLTTLNSAREFKTIIKKLDKLKCSRHDDKVYTATVDVSGLTLPDRENSKNSDEISDIIRDLPSRIFDKKDIVYKLSGITRTEYNIVINFHSEVYEEPEDNTSVYENPVTITEEQQEIDQNQQKEDSEAETPALIAADNSEQKADDDLTGNSTVETSSDATVIKIVEPPKGNERNITVVKKPTTNASSNTPRITIGEKPKGNESNITLATENTAEASSDAPSITIDQESKENNNDYNYEYTSASLPNSQTTWTQWAYDNMYYIIGTITCLGAACFFFYYNRYPVNPGYEDAGEVADQLRLDMGLSRGTTLENQQLLETSSFSEELSYMAEDAIENVRDLTETTLGKIGLSPIPRKFPVGFGTPQRPNLDDRFKSTPQACNTIATRTAQKVKQVVRDIHQEEQIFSDAAKQFVKHFKVQTSPWLAKGGKDVLEKYLKNLFKDAANIDDHPAEKIKDLLLENFRSDNTLDQKDFTSIIKSIGTRNVNDVIFTFQDAVRELNIHSVFGDTIENPEEAQTAANGLLADILNQADHKYILYVAIMTVFPLVNSEEIATEDNLNNNATEWHSLSMITEADFDDEGSEGDAIHYSKTHPQLVLKNLTKSTENSYALYPHLDLNYLSDGNIKCRLALKKAISDTADVLYISNMMIAEMMLQGGGTALKDIFSLSNLNQFVIIPQLLSDDMSDEPVNKFCDLAENGYEAALEFLGIDNSSE